MLLDILDALSGVFDPIVSAIRDKFKRTPAKL
jgi:hypothetical protein